MTFGEAQRIWWVQGQAGHRGWRPTNEEEEEEKERKKKKNKKIDFLKSTKIIERNACREKTKQKQK